MCTATTKADEPQGDVREWDARREAEAFLFHYAAKKGVGEGDPYEFYAEELAMAKVMGEAVARLADRALAQFDREAGLDTPSTEREVHSYEIPIIAPRRKASRINVRAILSGLATILSEAWTPEAERSIAEYVARIVDLGVERAGLFDKLELVPSRPTIEQGIVTSAKYYTNSYFNRIVLPAILGNVADKLDGGELNDSFLRELRTMLDRRLRAVPYWRLVAQQAASRSYHYGLARAGLSRGKTAYRLNATLDERTSSVCRNLHGRTFWLADAVAHLEHVATTPPEYIAEEAPWIEYHVVAGATDEELARARIMVPPFHPFCRTTIDLI